MSKGRKAKKIVVMCYDREAENFQWCTGDDVENVPGERQDDYIIGMTLGAEKDTTVYVHEMRLWGYDIANAFHKRGFRDVTKEDISISEMKPMDFSYLCSIGGTWYSVTVKTDKAVVKYASYGVLASTDEDEDICILAKGIAKDDAPMAAKIWASVTVLKSMHISKDTTSGSAFNLWKYGRYGRKTYKFYNNAPKDERYYQTMTDAKGLLPDANDIKLYGDTTLDEWLRPAYLGGWCYKKPGVHDVDSPVWVYDVNSLYPWISTLPMPIGKPTYVKGKIPERIDPEKEFCVVHIKAQFYLKKDHLPFVRIQNNVHYNPREIVESSDIIDRRTGEVYDELLNEETGEVYPVAPELTLTWQEYKLLHEQYDVKYEEPIDCVIFKTSRNVVGMYSKSMYRMRHSAGLSDAQRYVWKILQNGLIGYFGRRRQMRDKILFSETDTWVVKELKQPSYLYIGVAVTSFARVYMVRQAQKHYENFLYSDTDSLHLDDTADDLKISDKLGGWKIEKVYDSAVYYGEKTYVGYDVQKGKYCLTYAGLPRRQKEQAEEIFNSRRQVPEDIYREGFEKIVSYLAEKGSIGCDEGLYNDGVITYDEEYGSDWKLMKIKTSYDLRLGKPEKTQWFKRSNAGKSGARWRRKKKGRLLYEYWVVRDEG